MTRPSSAAMKMVVAALYSSPPLSRERPTGATSLHVLVHAITVFKAGRKECTNQKKYLTIWLSNSIYSCNPGVFVTWCFLSGFQLIEFAVQRDP
jgi:hypothetical protein